MTTLVGSWKRCRRLSAEERDCRQRLLLSTRRRIASTRLLSRVLLIALTFTAGGAAARSRQSIEAQQHKKVSQFVGKWVAESPTPDGVIRIEISADPGTIFIRTWSTCQQAPCYWGERPIDISDADDGVLSVTWAAASQIDSQRISLLPDGRLRVDVRTTRSDSSDPRDRTLYFVKSNSSSPARPDSVAVGKPPSVPDSAERSLSSVAVFFLEQPGGQFTPVGCGFLAQPGLVVTSYHVVKNLGRLQARVFGQSALYTVSAVVKTDQAHGIALVRIEGFRAYPLPLAEQREIAAGDQVFVITDASKGTISPATVSSVGAVNGISRIQITTPVSPIESGAPVFDKDGRVVGVADSNPEGAEKPGLLIRVTTLVTRLIALMPDLAPARAVPKAVDSRPVMITRVRPNYTEEARHRGVNGQVKMRILIGADGEVKDVLVLSGLPYGLTEEAVRVARASRFKPAMKDGQPVEFWIKVDIDFYLR